ncbi:hypothetical protein MVEN_01180500 [Mycena venus]|uniref:DUF6534 domain-containing protein n=1 Tax=Mycena venus TaxID=2733690 RepID=A0A8H6Y175_9AGAR|nr:hypothetical protein MVEN_01180500 [Mycena venus]
MSTSSPPINVAEFSGPLIIAYFLHWGLFGTLSVQLYLYYLAFPNDRIFTKCLVYTVYTLELVQTMFMTRDAFQTFGYGFGDPAAITDLYFAWLYIPVMGGLVAFIGQSFYAYRIYILSKRWIVPVLIVLVSLASSVGGCLLGGFSHIAGHLTLLTNSKITAGIWLGSSALSDISIAVCMTYYLSKSDTGFRRTHALVTRLIRLTVETGSLTAVVAVINLALLFAFPTKLYFVTGGLVLPKLYANTIYVILNARFHIVGGRGYSSSTMMSTPLDFRLNGPSGSSGTDGGLEMKASVRVRSALPGGNYESGEV